MSSTIGSDDWANEWCVKLGHTSTYGAPRNPKLGPLTHLKHAKICILFSHTCYLPVCVHARTEGCWFEVGSICSEWECVCVHVSRNVRFQPPNVSLCVLSLRRRPYRGRRNCAAMVMLLARVGAGAEQWGVQAYCRFRPVAASARRFIAFAWVAQIAKRFARIYLRHTLFGPRPTSRE